MDSAASLNTVDWLSFQSRFQPVKGLASKARHLTGTAAHLNSKTSKHQVENNKELMEVAKKFEAILVHQMLKAMRKTVHKSDLLNSFSLQQYESMMDEEIANEMVKHKGIGLADSLFYQLSRLENHSNPSSINEVKPNE